MFVNTKPTIPRLDDVISRENKPFDDSLVFDLQISTLTQPLPIVINGHNILRFSLDMRASGFTCELSFAIRDDVAFQNPTEMDKLLLLFRSNALLKVHLGIRPQRVEEDVETLTTVIPFTFVDGLVTEKSLVERNAHHLEGKQITYRLYHIRFADPAQVLWRQHFPLKLYTQTTLQAVIQDNVPIQYFTVQYIDTTLASTQLPQVMLGMVPTNRPGERASFYDLVMWQLDLTDRMWTYDYTLKVYKIIKIKTPPVATNVVADDIKDIFTYYPAPQRYQEYVLNDYTEAIQNRAVTPVDPTAMQYLVTGVRQDFQWNTQVQLEFEKEYQNHTTDFRLPKPEFVLSYRMFPSVPYTIGAGINFIADQLEFDQAAVAIPLEAKAEICRVFRIEIVARSLEDDIEGVYDGKAPAAVRLSLNVWLEASSNLERRIPPYLKPRYPVYIEGKILSEIGAPVEETYQIYPDPATFVQKYKVIIPLFQNQIITVPTNPNMDPGHFYFPPYKWERIVVAFYYDHSYLKRFLDWRPTAQLPLETQGDHLLLGKTPVNRTSVRHTYVDENPVFEIERLHVTNKIDCENIRIAEGSLTITVGMPLGMPPPGMPVQQTGSTTQSTSSSSGQSSSSGGQTPPRQGP